MWWSCCLRSVLFLGRGEVNPWCLRTPGADLSSFWAALCCCQVRPWLSLPSVGHLEFQVQSSSSRRSSRGWLHWGRPVVGNKTKLSSTWLNPVFQGHCSPVCLAVSVLFGLAGLVTGAVLLCLLLCSREATHKVLWFSVWECVAWKGFQFYFMIHKLFYTFIHFFLFPEYPLMSSLSLGWKLGANIFPSLGVKTDASWPSYFTLK